MTVTSGVDKDPDVLVKDTDYSVGINEVDDIDDDATFTETAIRILSLENITDDKITYSYKTSRDSDTEVVSTRAVEVGTVITLDSDTVISTVKVVSGGSAKKLLVEDEDYIAERNSDSAVVVTLLTDTKVVDDTINIAYHEAAPEKVTAWEVIGGISTENNEVKGLELVESIYSRLGVLPGILIAPKYSTNSAVAAVMKAKAQLIDGVFRAVAVVDLDTETAKNYTQAVNVKAEKNLVDTSLFVCYPKLSLDGVQYHLSTQMAALMGQVDADNKNIPYVSPSNHRLQADSTVTKDGEEMYLSQTQATYLNANGIVTALNHANGWILFGNSTSCANVETDPRLAWIPIRRMFNYVANSLVVSFFSRIDNPLNRRLIESITMSAGIWLDSLTASGAILGGRVEFLSDNNAITDLMSGILHFNVYITPPPPANEIVFTLEFDPNYLNTLFG